MISPHAHKKHRKLNAVLFVFQRAETTFYAEIVIVDFRKPGLSADERHTPVLNTAFRDFQRKNLLFRQVSCKK
ncbi:hypothetical protein [Undibacterium squillarum]|uniref:Uncharacterized protein n=1 Tax=Undibacterium squillarum TaxID=1131567 RepID=A0ABQ2XQR1_9BURK|nr:hypothetical protein [Undibacterium squillarum]GGX28027.1 hypothetical protein GCM10010946_00910 [Undibacterium squillarum]